MEESRKSKIDLTVNADGKLVEKKKIVTGKALDDVLETFQEGASQYKESNVGGVNKKELMNAIDQGHDVINVLTDVKNVAMEVGGIFKTDSTKGKKEDKILDGAMKEPSVLEITDQEKTVGLIITLTIVSVIALLVYEYATPNRKD